MRILIVEDDARIREPLATDLRRQLHTVDAVGDGIIGLDFARTNVHDVILLDVALPGMSGLEMCRRLRADRSPSLILIITARGSVPDKVRALDTGADDYLVKPFALEEVSARIRALARRQRSRHDSVLKHGRLRLDPTIASAWFSEVPLTLTATEYAILETLMRNPMQIFSRRMLREKSTNFGGGSDHDSIKAHISNLRKKLRAAGAVGDPIENVHGFGYRLAAVTE